MRGPWLGVFVGWKAGDVDVGIAAAAVVVYRQRLGIATQMVGSVG